MNELLLDEKGFVFIDANDRPYLCRMWHGKSWLFYWHDGNHWVSYREVSQDDIFSFPHNLAQIQQDIYHKQHSEWCVRFERQPEVE